MDPEAALGTGDGEARHQEEAAVPEGRHHPRHQQEEAATMEPEDHQWTGLADLPRG